MIKEAMRISNHRNKDNIWSCRNLADYGGRVVRLSAAVASLLPASTVIFPAEQAWAITANCTQRINFGKFALAAGVGSLTVTPLGLVPNNPSIVTISAAQPGQCKVSMLTGTTGTLQIQVLLSQAFLNNGGDKLTIKNFDISTKNAGRTKTYFSATITNTVKTYDMGATLRIESADPAGGYTGSVMILHTYTN